MSVSIWTPHDLGAPLLAGWAHEDDRQATVVRLTGSRVEQRARRGQRAFRSFPIVVRADMRQRAAIRAFLVSVGYGADSFYCMDVTDDGDSRYAVRVAMGTSTALQTVFPVPSTGEAGGYWPLNDVSTVLYDDGVAVTRTVQTDARTITASVAPAGSSVMTAEFLYFKRYAIRGPVRWSPAEGDPALWDCSMTWEEVPA